jgi:hypothetical protein
MDGFISAIFSHFLNRPPHDEHQVVILGVFQGEGDIDPGKQAKPFPRVFAGENFLLFLIKLFESDCQILFYRGPGKAFLGLSSGVGSGQEGKETLFTPFSFIPDVENMNRPYISSCGLD